MKKLLLCALLSLPVFSAAEEFYPLEYSQEVLSARLLVNPLNHYDVELKSYFDHDGNRCSAEVYCEGRFDIESKEVEYTKFPASTQCYASPSFLRRLPDMKMYVIGPLRFPLKPMTSEMRSVTFCFGRV